MLRKYASLRHLFWTVVTASDIDPHMKFGSDFMLPHPNGVVIHEDAVIGNNCMVMQQVTIGMTAEGKAPTIGNDVYIGAGAKILGNVRVGDGVRIGAQAVVLSDVPAHCTVVGIPARIIRRSPSVVSIASD
jgi:serine O-acetyltransferase